MNWAGWEAQLVAWHTEYRAQGRGLIVRCPPQVAVVGKVGRGGVFRAKWTGKGPVDFIGNADGRGAYFDAKLCSGARWELRGRGGLKPHQARMLRHAHEQGSRAFVALHMAGRPWVVPFEAIAASERKSWPADLVALMGIPMLPNGWIGVTFP